MHLILFIVFAGLCLAGAINLLLQSHPINSALSLIVVMTSLAVLYLLLGAEFLAAAQVIVYGGAIMVLFTFVIMLLNAGREERTLSSRAARARKAARKGRAANEFSSLGASSPLLVSAVERGAVFAGRGGLSHQAQSDYCFHVD